MEYDRYPETVPLPFPPHVYRVSPERSSSSIDMNTPVAVVELDDSEPFAPRGYEAICSPSPTNRYSELLAMAFISLGGVVAVICVRLPLASAPYSIREFGICPGLVLPPYPINR